MIFSKTLEVEILKKINKDLNTFYEIKFDI